MEAQKVNDAVFEKIRKLLNLAKDGGATESEAANAMEKAQAIMAENNLSMASMEAKGDTSKVADGAKRTKANKSGKALYKYQQRLMETVGYTNFCHTFVDKKWNGKRFMECGYIVIGREANVAAVHHQFDYLNTSLERILTPHLSSNSERVSRKGVSFKEGASARLCERLMTRYNQRLKDQAEDARGQRTENALVVVLEDYAAVERDLNYDLYHNLEPGTTARRRKASKEKAEAFKLAEELRRSLLSDAERQREDRERAANMDKWRKKAARSVERFWANRDEDAYLLGYKEADKVGLDDQITKDARK